MPNTISAMNGIEIFFLICAVIGGFFVIVKLVLQLIGADADVDTDIDSDIHTDSDAGFKLLSIYGITSFLLMFGLVGLALYHQSQAGFLVSIIGATAAGFASFWVIGRLFTLVGRLKSSGTLDTASAVGSKGTVYLNIPAGGTGRVTINMNGHLREFDAVTVNQAALLTGTPIFVVRVDANVLVVDKIN